MDIVFMSTRFTSNYKMTIVFYINSSCFNKDIVSLIENEATFTYDIDGMYVKLRDVKKDVIVNHDLQIFLEIYNQSVCLYV